mmetsp:Transcript_46035/g.103984  ORF Transcript_46035/g.103984 Transcript_46035/m.103984 type:complete len:245 (-) Transcript_46035:380-1114(-)
MSEVPCYANPLFALICTVPLGGFVGLAISSYGFDSLGKGLTKLNNGTEEMGVDLESVQDLVDLVGYAFIIANVLVVLYGLREKIRIWCGLLNHLHSCTPCLVKFVFKGLINLLVTFALVLVLVLAALFEAIYVICWALDSMCTTGVASAIEEIMDMMGGSTASIDQICKAADEAKEGALQCTIACFVLVGAQIIIGAYWMKYSTLANVVSYKDQGQIGEAHDVEVARQRDGNELPKKPKAPRKI